MPPIGISAGVQIEHCRGRSIMHSPLRVVAFVLAGAALGLRAPAWTQAQSLDAQIEPVRVKYGLPALAAAVAKKGEIVAAGAVGVRVHGTSIGVTIDDRFHLGSDTKAMTATLAGILVAMASCAGVRQSARCWAPMYLA